MGHGQRDSRRRREAWRQRLRQTGKPRADAEGRSEGRSCAQGHVVRWALVYEQLAQAPIDEAQRRDRIASRRAFGGPLEVGTHARAAFDGDADPAYECTDAVDADAAHDAIARSSDDAAQPSLIGTRSRRRRHAVERRRHAVESSARGRVVGARSSRRHAIDASPGGRRPPAGAVESSALRGRVVGRHASAARSRVVGARVGRAGSWAAAVDSSGSMRSGTPRAARA